MPEALACIFVISLSLALVAYARVQNVNAIRLHPEVEPARADVHIAWLEERIALARREKWEHAMIASLEGRLAEERRLRDEVAATIV